MRVCLCTCAWGSASGSGEETPGSAISPFPVLFKDAAASPFPCEATLVPPILIFFLPHPFSRLHLLLSHPRISVAFLGLWTRIKLTPNRVAEVGG